jgi:RNA polymerase sigma-70 factor (ECF subfamily)
MEFDDSPVVALNRAVAVAKVYGPKAGLVAVESIPERDKLNSYYLLYAVLGELEAQLENWETAAGHFRKSLTLAEIKSEQAFLSKRLSACEA